MKKITVKGEGMPVGDPRFLETLIVEIDGQEYVIEDDESGRNWFNFEGDWIEAPDETAEEADAVDEARMAYWDAYQAARRTLGVDKLEDECHKRAIAAVATGVEVKQGA